MKENDLDIEDYDILIVALRNIELYEIETTEEYYNKLMLKLERNRYKLECNNNFNL